MKYKIQTRTKPKEIILTEKEKIRVFELWNAGFDVIRCNKCGELIGIMCDRKHITKRWWEFWK